MFSRRNFLVTSGLVASAAAFPVIAIGNEPISTARRWYSLRYIRVLLAANNLSMSEKDIMAYACDSAVSFEPGTLIPSGSAPPDYAIIKARLLVQFKFVSKNISEMSCRRSNPACVIAPSFFIRERGTVIARYGNGFINFYNNVDKKHDYGRMFMETWCKLTQGDSSALSS